MSEPQDFEIHGEKAGIVVSIDCDNEICVDAYDEYESIHVIMSADRAKEIGQALLDMAAKAVLLAKESKQ